MESNVLSPSQVRRVLFVCTGNSCRSVMAEGLLKKMLGQDHPIQVVSAGIGTMGGSPPTGETLEVLNKEGVEMSGHVSQPVTPNLVNRSDLILVMERFHLDALLEKHPEKKDAIFLLKEFQVSEKIPDPDVPDPIGLPLRMYERCVGIVKESVERVHQWLTSEN